jgi:hypothetical protein
MAGIKPEKKKHVSRLDDPRRWETFRAADQIRAEGKQKVSLRTVSARIKLNGGVPGSNQVVGAHVSAWNEDRSYDAEIETAGMPKSVSTQMSKACVALWQAAEVEAAAILGRERDYMAVAIAFERELASEALGMVDARDAVIEGLRAEISRQAAELDGMRKKDATVRAREFWRRVIREILEILPEREAMHVNDITMRIGADLVQEAAEHKQVWDVDTVRGAIDERRYRRRLFVWEGDGRYRRRRPEDGGVAA